MIRSKYRDYRSFYGKTRIIFALLGFIPFLLVIYMFICEKIDLTETMIIFLALILFSILAGFSLMRRSADQLVSLSREIAVVQAEEKEEPIRVEADQELNDIADHFNSLLKKLQQLNRNIREQNIQLLTYARDLSLSHNNLKQAYLEAIHRLAIASEYRDEDTAMHLKRMSNYSAIIARGMGLRDKEVDLILYASPMHDVGKIGIPDNILFKSDKLTPEEFEIIKTHCSIGGRILVGSESEIIQMAEQIAISHHEKWNGMGYPYGLKGEEIPLVGRITALADVFDALTTKRPYKPAFSNDRAYKIIREEKGKHFDPQVVDAFFRSLDEIDAVYKKFQE
ncbi:MAG: HD domain-containing phosphohydrolase [Thermodesulfobacteriota bacterium]